MTDRPLKRVLFVCVENSNHSQMAEAFAHLLTDPPPGCLIANTRTEKDSGQDTLARLAPHTARPPG